MAMIWFIGVHSVRPSERGESVCLPLELLEGGAKGGMEGWRHVSDSNGPTNGRGVDDGERDDRATGEAGGICWRGRNPSNLPLVDLPLDQ